jgi:hypothetical protein
VSLGSPLRRAVTIAVAALVGALVAVVLVDLGRGPATVGDDLPTATGLPDTAGASPRTPARAVAPGRVGVRPAGLPAVRPTAAPTLLRIPRLGLALPVDPAGVAEDGQMALPDDPTRLSWYRFGAGPLSSRGATVLGGHVDTIEAGAGPLARLATARPGDRLQVVLGRRTVAYRITSVTRIPKVRLDTGEVFARGGPPRLHLLTCGGAYLPDRGGYQDNVVVVARPVR